MSDDGIVVRVTTGGRTYDGVSVLGYNPSAKGFACGMHSWVRWWARDPASRSGHSLQSGGGTFVALFTWMGQPLSRGPPFPSGGWQDVYGAR